MNDDRERIEEVRLARAVFYRLGWEVENSEMDYFQWRTDK